MCLEWCGIDSVLHFASIMVALWDWKGITRNTHLSISFFLFNCNVALPIFGMCDAFTFFVFFFALFCFVDLNSTPKWWLYCTKQKTLPLSLGIDKNKHKTGNLFSVCGDDFSVSCFFLDHCNLLACYCCETTIINNKTQVCCCLCSMDVKLSPKAELIKSCHGQSNRETTTIFTVTSPVGCHCSFGNSYILIRCGKTMPHRWIEYRWIKKIKNPNQPTSPNQHTFTLSPLTDCTNEWSENGWTSVIVIGQCWMLFNWWRIKGPCWSRQITSCHSRVSTIIFFVFVFCFRFFTTRKNSDVINDGKFPVCPGLIILRVIVCFWMNIWGRIFQCVQLPFQLIQINWNSINNFQRWKLQRVIIY